MLMPFTSHFLKNCKWKKLAILKVKSVLALSMHMLRGWYIYSDDDGATLKSAIRLSLKTVKGAFHWQ